MKGDKNALNLISYVALVIVAFLLLINTILPILGININGALVSLLSTVQNLLVLIVIGINAYTFASTNKKWVRILFWVAVIVFVAATVLIWIKF